MTTGEKIKRLRQEKGYTQDELAEKLHVSRQTISKWEKDKVMPDTSNLAEIAKLFSVSSDYLIQYLQNTSLKKTSSMDKILLLVGFIAFILFAVLLLTNKVDKTSSVIQINAYGFLCLFFLILSLGFVFFVVKHHEKK